MEYFIYGTLAILLLFFMSKRKAKPTKIVIKTKELDGQDEDVYSMHFEVVGESFKNEDGTSRQEIIKKYAQEGQPAHLKFYAYKGNPACAVYTDEAQTKQIGNLPKDEVQEVYELATSGAIIDPRIYAVNTGSKGLYGVSIEILVNDE